MLIAKNVKKNYNNREILKGIDLVVNDGEFVSIMGESGSGKTTLLSILSGNLRPDEGTVTFDGFEIGTACEREMAHFRRTSLGFVYQSLNLISTLTAADNVLLPLYLAKEDMAKGREYMLRLAKRLGISHLLDSMPDELSGGERQRVAIARALIHHPKIIMMDEPTGSLDSRSTKEVLELISGINKDMGVSIIQVTHSPEAAAYADRIIHVKDGEVVTL